MASLKRVFHLVHGMARRNAVQAVQEAPDGWMVVVQEPTRSLEQNAAQWPILTAFSQQLQWPVNGALCWMTPEEWKDILTAAFKQENVRLAQGLNGGVVMLGDRTSKFGKKQFSEWLEFLHSVAADRGVVVYPDEQISGDYLEGEYRELSERALQKPQQRIGVVA